MADDLLDVIAEHDSIESIEAVVMDGSKTNTVDISHVKYDMSTVILWLVYQLHGNELPFGHLSSQGFRDQWP